MKNIVIAIAIVILGLSTTGCSKSSDSPNTANDATQEPSITPKVTQEPSITPSKTATLTSTSEVQQIFVEDCASAFSQRPSFIYLACADGGMGLSDIIWSNWGSQRANGSGDYFSNNCDPSCADGKFSKIPVVLVLSGVVPDTGNRFVFSKVAVTVSGEGVLFANRKRNTFELTSATPESIISERAKVPRISTQEARSAARAVALSVKAVADSYTAAATAWGRTAYFATVAATDSAHSGSDNNDYKIAFYAAGNKAGALSKGIAKEVASVSLARETFFGTPEGKTYKNTLDYHISYEALKISLGIATSKSTQAGIARTAYQSAYDDYVSNFTDPFNINAIAYAYFEAASSFASASKATAVEYAYFYNLSAEFWAALAG